MKVAKVAVSLPGDLLDEIDRECRASGQTRSAYFAAVLERHVRESGQRAQVNAYIRGYKALPESDTDDPALEEVVGEAWHDLDRR